MDSPRTVVLAGERPAGLSLSGRPRLDKPRLAEAAPDRAGAAGEQPAPREPGRADVRGTGGVGIGIDLSPVGAPTAQSGYEADPPDDAIPDTVATGFARLDAELPGGGWPCRALAELLLPPAGAGELRLLAPALRAALHADRTVMLFDPPPGLTARSLARLGLDAEHLLIVEGRSRALPDAGSLWALEQALKSGHVGAIVAWLPPRLTAERLRRLQVAAQRHDGPAFVLREAAAAARPTAAPLRLALHPAGDDALTLRLLKRRLPASVPPSAGLLRLTLPAAVPVPVPRDTAAVSERTAAVSETQDGTRDETAAAPSQASLFAPGRPAAPAEPSSAPGARFASARPVGRPRLPDRPLHAAVFVDLAV